MAKYQGLLVYVLTFEGDAGDTDEVIGVFSEPELAMEACTQATLPWTEEAAHSVSGKSWCDASPSATGDQYRIEEFLIDELSQFGEEIMKKP